MVSMKILVLQGGTSNEREVSLRSAANVIQHLRGLGHEVAVADPADKGFDITVIARECDMVLPVLHGAGGEDGVLQRQLEGMGAAFLGSGSEACALTFDKAKYRDFMAGHDVQMARGQVVDRAQFDASELRKASYVLKPITGGSSLDTVILNDLAKEPAAVYFDELFARYGTMLLEQLIKGQEITVGVLGDQALPVILIIPPSDGEFDYENKYNGRTQEIVNPTQISSETLARAQELALSLHNMAGCRHLSRTDMIVMPGGELYVLETNTLPGMTEQSLFPKAAATAGYDMSELVKRFVEMAKAL